ncbi:MAG: PQQ-dependent sugar dehydrogenase [Erythrobacter sp.]|jgi:glucose/arabinose dehydrogenase|nr:PQQ-dependent sugar dehydrogenase [Erythrobacter sp.]
MTGLTRFAFTLSLPALALASCAQAEVGDSAAQGGMEEGGQPFESEVVATFEEPWAIEFAPGTRMLFVTEQGGSLKVMDTGTGAIGTVSGVPAVDYGGQGGLGDIAFLPGEADAALTGRTIYLTFAEAGEGDTRGAALGRGTLECGSVEACAIQGFEVIWRQAPKVTGRGHYSHRVQVAPDGQHLFVASGERQKQTPAQDLTNTLGTIVRLNLDGTPAAGNPFADEPGVPDEIWSYGHRNILGMDFDADGRLWETEHGPAGGDELNIVERAANYGWPERSYGDNYNGTPIPDHSADDGFVKPLVHWTPVIAPGDMIIHSGDLFEGWQGDALITGLSTEALIVVALDGESAREVARYEMGNRLRSIEEGPDGAVWIAEDGEEGRLLKLTPR